MKDETRNLEYQASPSRFTFSASPAHLWSSEQFAYRFASDEVLLDDPGGGFRRELGVAAWTGPDDHVWAVVAMILASPLAQIDYAINVLVPKLLLESLMNLLRATHLAMNIAAYIDAESFF